MYKRSLRVAVIGSLCAIPVVAVHARTSPTLTRIELLLTAAPALSEAARHAMMQEAAAIWRQHDVAIEWLAPTVVRSVAPHRMRVLIVEQRPLMAASENQFSIGELIRPTGGHPIAFVSIEGARRLMASVKGRAGYGLITVDERRLGVVLGRALAHEVGHYLLGTHTHARHGLMRPHFSAFEFTDLRDGTFALDDDAAAWLRQREAGKFAYEAGYRTR